LFVDCLTLPINEGAHAEKDRRIAGYHTYEGS
jgi:hypothetical protein